jgi:hypothetical protein
MPLQRLLVSLLSRRSAFQTDFVCRSDQVLVPLVSAAVTIELAMLAREPGRLSASRQKQTASASFTTSLSSGDLKGRVAVDRRLRKFSRCGLPVLVRLRNFVANNLAHLGSELVLVWALRGKHTADNAADDTTARQGNGRQRRRLGISLGLGCISPPPRSLADPCQAAEARLAAEEQPDPEKIKKRNKELWNSAYNPLHLVVHVLTECEETRRPLKSTTPNPQNQSTSQISKSSDDQPNPPPLNPRPQQSRNRKKNHCG